MGKLGELDARLRVMNRLAGESHEAADDDVAVARVQFDQTSLSLCLFGRNGRGSATREAVDDDVSPLADILDGVCHQDCRLDCWMHIEFFVAAALEGVGAGIGPDICSISATFTQPEIVDVLLLALLQDISAII
jgi:hypothetical protein